MTDTPETDAAAVFPSCNDSSDTSHPQGTHVATDFARKLERERDEAREQLTAERALANRLASELSDLWHNYSLWCDAYDDMEAMEAALTAWKEARDGSRQG